MIVGGGVFSFSHYPWLAEVNRISDAMLHGINPKLTEDGTGATYRNPGVCWMLELVWFCQGEVGCQVAWEKGVVESKCSKMGPYVDVSLGGICYSSWVLKHESFCRRWICWQCTNPFAENIL